MLKKLPKIFSAICASVILAAATPATAEQPPVESSVDATATDPLMQSVDEAIRVTSLRNLDFQQHRPWQILHGLLALRENYTIKNGPEFVNALDYLSHHARFKGDAWFEATPYGAKAHPYNGTPYDFEGHVNQTLAIVAMCNVPLTHTFTTKDGRTVTMADMIRHAQMSVNTREELTWTLWFLTHYLDQDTTWVAADGQKWSMETLVRHQNNTNVYNAPCGGCHNLFALSYARNSFMQKHGALRGAWLEADQKIQQYIAASQTMQNQDGSFATQYYKARGQSAEFNDRIKSSGHILEWLMVGMSRKRLEEPWLRKGIQTLSNDLITNASQPADCGPLYHSLHALVLYKQRMQIANESARKQDHVAAKPETRQELALPPLPVGMENSSVTGGQSAGQPNPLAVPQQPGRLAPLALPSSGNAAPSATANSEFKAPLTVPSTGLNRMQNVPAPLQVAQPSAAPALVQPPQSSGNEIPRILPRRPSRMAEQERPLRRLSNEDDVGLQTPKAEQADQNIVVPSKLSPVTGGMPMLVKPLQANAAPQTPTKPAVEEKATTDTPESTEQTLDSAAPSSVPTKEPADSQAEPAADPPVTEGSKPAGIPLPEATANEQPLQSSETAEESKAAPKPPADGD